jgi:hypothetical protein
MRRLWFRWIRNGHRDGETTTSEGGAPVLPPDPLTAPAGPAEAQPARSAASDMGEKIDTAAEAAADAVQRDQRSRRPTAGSAQPVPLPGGLRVAARRGAKVVGSVLIWKRGQRLYCLPFDRNSTVSINP